MNYFSMYSRKPACDPPGSTPSLKKGVPIVESIFEYRRDFLGLLKKVAAVGDIATFEILGEQLVLVNNPDL